LAADVRKGQVEQAVLLSRGERPHDVGLVEGRRDRPSCRKRRRKRSSPASSAQLAGVMFGFIRKRFPGSYFAFSAASRS
jgi:hypothetical protein